MPDSIFYKLTTTFIGISSHTYIPFPVWDTDGSYAAVLTAERWKVPETMQILVFYSVV